MPGREKEKVTVSTKPFKEFDKGFPLKKGRYNFYTPLNRSRENILQEVCNTELLTLPRPGKSPANADRNKECKWHQNYGHTTEKCVTLQDKIEDLVQTRHLE